jgi:hypothetical protein
MPGTSPGHDEEKVTGLACVAEALGGFEIDRDELAHAALGHGHAE